jgi:hypothetical protein
MPAWGFVRESLVLEETPKPARTLLRAEPQRGKLGAGPVMDRGQRHKEVTMPASPRVLHSLLLVAALASGAALPPAAAAAEPVVERLGVPGPIRFGDTDFALSWSSNPSPELFKQEYLPAGQDPEHYDAMVMLDLRPDGANAGQMAAGMIEQLKARKASDPVTHYDLLINEHSGEVLLDFLISAPDPKDGLLVEWNAYRYVTEADGTGTRMLGISRRAYGDAAVRAFLVALKDARPRDITTLGKLPLPDVKRSVP